MDTVQLADQYLFANSLKTDNELRLAKSKTVITLTDLAKSGYQSGLVEIDATSQLNGSSGFASLKDSYLVIPYVITAKNGTAASTAAINRYACGLKCGTHNIIDSVELTMNGKSILTHNEYKQFWNNLRLQTETSVADLSKRGSDAFLAPDNWYSINHSTTASAFGDGYSNTAINFTGQQFDPTIGNTGNPRDINNGFIARLVQTPPPVDVAGTHAAFGWASMSGTTARTIVQQSGRGAFVEGTANANEIAGTWYYLLKVRLIDLHPIFKELDLMANPQLKLRLRFNTGTVTISGTPGVTTPGSETNGTMKLDSVTMRSGHVCPIMIAPAAVGSPMHGKLSASAGANLTFAFGVLGNQFTDKGALGEYYPNTDVRLQIPFYDFHDPRQIISKPIKTVRFLDCYSQYFSQRAGLGVTNAKGSSFNFQLSGTKKNIKYVALIPFAETSAGHWATAAGVEQFESPFDSAPQTCMPGALVRNFQVQIGNQNVFAKTHEYDYEQFIEEFSKLSAINGDQTREMNNGLIDYYQWTYANHVLIADCSRISAKDVPQSIQVSGTNECSQGMNILVLVVYEREMELDRLTGEIQSFDA